MVHRFKDLLQRKAGDALENWNVPFFHIGGAGTHFPRRGKDGKPIYPPNMLSPEKALVHQDMGPHPWVGRGAETPRADLRDVQAMLEAIGFGGEWFDSHDVEEYLKTKGIHLDGHSSFVEIEAGVIIPRMPSPQSASTIGSGLTSPTENTLRTPSPTMPTYHDLSTTDSGDLFTQQEMNELFPATIISEAAPGFQFKDVSSFPPRPQDQLSNEQVYNQQIWPWNSDGSYSYYPSDASDASELFPQLSASVGAGQLDFTSDFGGSMKRRSTPMTLDVEQFLERMVEGGACLGRAPGFRKDLVENALALSVTEGF